MRLIHLTTVTILSLFFTFCYPLKCYEGRGPYMGDGAPNLTVKEVNATEDTRCARYQLCANPNGTINENGTICFTTTEQNTTLIWYYLSVPESSCAELIKYPHLYINLYCCNTDLCNAPVDNSAVPTTPTEAPIQLKSTGTRSSYNWPALFLSCLTIACNFLYSIRL